MGSPSSKQSDHIKYRRPNIPENPWIPFSYDDKAYNDLLDKTSTYEGIIEAFQFMCDFCYFNKCMHDSFYTHCSTCKIESYYSEEDRKENAVKWIGKVPHNFMVYIPIIQSGNVHYKTADEKSIYICCRYLIDNIKDQNDENIQHIVKLNKALSKLMAFYDSYKIKGLKNLAIDKYRNSVVLYRKYMDDNMKIINTFDEIKKIIAEVNNRGETNQDSDINDKRDENIDNHGVEGYDESKTALPSAPSN